MLTGMNWFDGAEYCYYQNAILAQVPDLATQTFLEYHAADIHNGNPEFWLGANDIFTVSQLFINTQYMRNSTLRT